MNLQILTTSETGTVRLVGALDIYGAELARTALLERLAHRPALILDLRGVETCDAAGVQLLLAAHRSAVAAGKSLVVAAAAPVVEACGRSLGVPPETLLPDTL